MKLRHKLENMKNEKNAYLVHEEETTCPMCKAKISPVFISAILHDRDDATVLNYCCACKKSFITRYDVYLSKEGTTSSEVYNGSLRCSEPNQFEKKIFDEKLISISPQFDKIYNQALAAEISGLDEIAGLGYRKALEFLVKDFVIYKNSTEEEKIKRMPLSACISEYIDNQQIKVLVERSAWIGNDEAHYVRKQEDRDVNDMKEFITATVFFIGMVLIADDAATMCKK